MKKYFSIGEMSKLYNISIETLRHYDRIGILKPEYINKKQDIDITLLKVLYH